MVERFEAAGNYAIGWHDGEARVVAWVRASPRQDWAPLGGYEIGALAINQAAARAACNTHWQKIKATGRANGASKL